MFKIAAVLAVALAAVVAASVVEAAWAAWVALSAAVPSAAQQHHGPADEAVVA